MDYTLENLLDFTIEQKASDLHLQVGTPPTLRISQTLVPIKGPPLNSSNTLQIAQSVVTKTQWNTMEEEGDVDFALNYKEKARFRVSLFKTKTSFGLVLRKIPSEILNLSQIGFPDSIIELLTRPRGLILVTGPTGSGKTTTLASMLDWINKNRNGHIITIEDPIEFLFKHENCIVTQREIGPDTKNFKRSLRAALRQDPDIIMVGEMRDYETIRAAISAAETGHLVLATLHTTGAARTVDRIIDVFPSEARSEVRVDLASSILAVISQTLLKKIHGGVVTAFEIMVKTDAIASLIREQKTFRINSEIQTGTRYGMITLDAHLQYLYAQGLITAQDAIDKSQYPIEMKTFLSQAQP